ncbi:MAG: MFS transporter [Chloroflexi bacterium]|nr:MFS transporter [Chloroflexota bacterium]
MAPKPPGSPLAIAAILTATGFCVFTAIGLVAALLVDMSAEFGVSVAALGQLAALSAFVWAASAPAIGPLSDRLGRKLILLIGLATLAVSMSGYGLSPNIATLVIFSIISGVGCSMVGPSVVAFAGDYFARNAYGKAMAAVAASLPTASLFGVPAGAVIAHTLDWRWAFFALALFILAIAALDFFWLPDIRAQRSGKTLGYLLTLRETFKWKPFLPLLSANVLYQAGYWSLATYLAAFLIQSYVMSLGQVAPLLSAIAVGQLLGTIAGGPIADRFNRVRVCALTVTLAGGLALVLVLVTRDPWVSVLSGALAMGLWGANRPAFLSLMASASSDIRGTAMGFYTASNQIGRGLGAAAGGLLLGLLGYPFIGVLCFAASFLAGVLYYVPATLKEAGARARAAV